MTPQEQIDTLRGALSLALKYLDHPEVREINFVLSAGTAAKRAREALEATKRQPARLHSFDTGCPECGAPALVTGEIHARECSHHE